MFDLEKPQDEDSRGNGMKKNLFLIGFITAVIMFFAGCASTPIAPLVEDVSYPSIGDTTTKSIGETLISQGTRESYSAIEIMQDENKGKVPKGIYIATKSTQGYIIYKPHPDNFIAVQMFENNFLALSDNQLYYGAYGGVGNVFPYRQIPESSYRMTSVAIESQNNFQRVLIYTGKDKNTVKFSYREFSGNFARPAFTVDVSYDIDDSAEIAYQKARLKIIEATNVSITYIVLHNFN